MSNNNSSANSGIGFIGLLQILFIALKLLDKVDWSWFWVLSPTIFSTVIFIVAVTLMIVLFKK